jgi:hypothetical protein
VLKTQDLFDAIAERLVVGGDEPTSVCSCLQSWCSASRMTFSEKLFQQALRTLYGLNIPLPARWQKCWVRHWVRSAAAANF